MNGPLISIIIPVYNTDSYLCRCLDSIINQTYENIELICIDDGSTDSSGAILDEYARIDKRIHVVHKNNEGVAVARNTAMSTSKGEYISFVDSDDYISSEMFEKMLGAFEKDVDIVSCNFSYSYNDGRIERIENKKEVPEEALNPSDMLRYMYERDLYRGVSGYLWTRMVRSQLIKGDDRLVFRRDLDTTDDIVFVAELTCRSRKIKYINESFYYYTQREGSIVHDDEENLRTLVWCKSWEETIRIYEDAKMRKEDIDYIRRMYVYRCGKILEYAIKKNNKEKIEILKEKIRPFLDVYEKTNIEYPDRIKWIKCLVDTD